MSSKRGAMLIALARHAIAEHLRLSSGLSADLSTGLSTDLPADTDAQWLSRKRASFVTLTIDGQLRGCIGSLQAHRPLIEDLRANAIAAAFHDPRFPPLSREAFATIHIEISLLGDASALEYDNEASALEQIRPGIDGVILQYGSHQATFLPQVWDQLPDRSQFMAHLKMKAGLPADFWHPDIRLSIYQVEKFREAR